MPVVHTADAYAVEQVPIEQIELGDWIVTAQPNGEPRYWQVQAKRFNYVAGETPRIRLKGQPESVATHAAGCEATVGTLVYRIIPAPRQQQDAAKAPADAPDNTKPENDSDYRHPKCYANTRGGCSTKISGEHFISHGLIKLYSFDDPELKIKHDTGQGVREFVSPKKFVAKILCEKHNNDLHNADDAALGLATFMRTISLSYLNGAGEWGDYEEITISGDDFQAWVLKLILNHVVGKAFRHQKGEFVSPFPPEAVDVLLGRAMWPRTWGLCVAGDVKNKDLRINAFDRWEDATTEQCSFQPLIHNDGWVGGGIVNLNGVGFGLTVFNPSRDNPEAFNNLGNPLRGSIQRPGFMAWELSGVQKRVNFTWSDRLVSRATCIIPNTLRSSAERHNNAHLDAPSPRLTNLKAASPTRAAMTTTSGIPTPAPGRLGDPMMDLGSDPRSDPRMIAALAPHGLDKATPPPPVGRASPREEQLAYVAATEATSEALFRALVADLPAIDGVGHSTETITGFDGNDIALYVSRPLDRTGALPGVLHIHGGAMVSLSATGPVFVRLRDTIAQTGVAVIGVEFRNGGGALGPYPYPAGLNDCNAALRWVHDNRNALGISTLTLAGESGGGNLSLATTLKAKRDGCIQMIDGVCALVPYISGMYGRPKSELLSELPSLVENEGYFMSCTDSDVNACIYDPGGEHATDPLCWPYHATVGELAGLPPHLISVNELDPVRDEGVAYYQKLKRAGVAASLRTVPGACHAADIMLPAHMPDAYQATVTSLHDFAASL